MRSLKFFNILWHFQWQLILCCFVWSGGAFAQVNYPLKPIKIVVPFGAGGVADLTARTVAQKMGDNMGQSIVIENKPGAGGVVATEMVAKSTPDGYTLLLMSNATAVSAGLFKSLPYDAEKDFTPLSVLGSFDLASEEVIQAEGQEADEHADGSADRARPLQHAAARAVGADRLQFLVADVLTGGDDAALHEPGGIDAIEVEVGTHGSQADE